MNKKMRRTPWFPGTAQPAHKGVYERAYPAGGECLDTVFCMWTGKAWRVWEDDPATAAKSKANSMFQDLPWRGLAENPEAKHAR